MLSVVEQASIEIQDMLSECRPEPLLCSGDGKRWKKRTLGVSLLNVQRYIVWIAPDRSSTISPLSSVLSKHVSACPSVIAMPRLIASFLPSLTFEIVKSRDFYVLKWRVGTIGIHPWLYT